MTYTISAYSTVRGFIGNPFTGLKTQKEVKAAMKSLRSTASALIVANEHGHICAIAVRRSNGWAAEWIPSTIGKVVASMSSAP